jgi:hypothetical protein
MTATSAPDGGGRDGRRRALSGAQTEWYRQGRLVTRAVRFRPGQGGDDPPPSIRSRKHDFAKVLKIPRLLSLV